MFYDAKHTVLSGISAFMLSFSDTEIILYFEQCGYLSIRIFEYIASVQSFNF